jgi:NAD(P)H-dependent FMN reductase
VGKSVDFQTEVKRKMKVLAISGSKNREGKTARAIEAIRQGVSRAKGDSECIFLTELNLEKCRQCNPDGWGICRSEHRCIIEDDFTATAEKVKKADVLVFATPVYFGDLSEAMRGFLDKLRRTSFRFGPPPRPGAPPAIPAGQATPAVGLCYAGGSGNGTVSCAFFLERILQTCGFDVVDMIPVRRQNLEMKLPHLESVGEWLVTRPVSGPPPAPPTPAR